MALCYTCWQDASPAHRPLSSVSLLSYCTASHPKRWRRLSDLQQDGCRKKTQAAPPPPHQVLIVTEEQKSIFCSAHSYDFRNGACCLRGGCKFINWYIWKIKSDVNTALRWGLRGEKGSYSSPTNLFSAQQPEAEAIKTTEIASMDTVAVIVWRDSNFNGPTGFLMSVVPQTKWAN